MPRTRGTVLMALVVLEPFFVGCGGDNKKPEDATSGGACACGATSTTQAGGACTCAELVASKNGWCDHCGAGMVNGQRTTCRACARAGKMCDACAANGGKPCP